MLKLPKKLKYVIATTRRYYNTTLPVILESMRTISIDDIIIVINDCRNEVQYKDYRTFCVEHNAFEYSALIYLSEINFQESEYVFLLHDTMVCGSRFESLSKSFTKGPDVILCHSKGFTNMGAYKTHFLNNSQHVLCGYKKIDKARAVEIEGNFFRTVPSYYADARSYNLERNVDFYGTGTSRIVDYYPAVDVSKVGANGQKQFTSKQFIVDL